MSSEILPCDARRSPDPEDVNNFPVSQTGQGRSDSDLALPISNHNETLLNDVEVDLSVEELKK